MLDLVILAASGAKESAGGLPQLDPQYFAGQLFWLAVAFAFLYFVMSRVALPRIATVIEERRDRIADDLDKASELKTQADQAIRSYEKAVADAKAKARALADDARKRIKAETDRLRSEAETKLNEKLVAAEGRIQATKVQALSNVRGIAAEAVQAIVQRLTDEAIPLVDAERALDNAKPAGARG